MPSVWIEFQVALWGRVELTVEYMWIKHKRLNPPMVLAKIGAKKEQSFCDWDSTFVTLSLIDKIHYFAVFFEITMML